MYITIYHYQAQTKAASMFVPLFSVHVMYLFFTYMCTCTHKFWHVLWRWKQHWWIDTCWIMRLYDTAVLYQTGDGNHLVLYLG